MDGTTYRALRVTCRPVEYGALGYYGLSMQSGTMAASLGANSEIFQFRYPLTTFAVVYSVWISAGANVAASAAVLAAFRLSVARAWSAAGSGGTRATMTGNNQKMRTSMATSGVNDIGIATTAALTAGTKTFDAQDLGGVAFGVGTGALTVSANFPWVLSVPLLETSDVIAHPLVCTNTASGGGEGFAIRIGANALPAGATWTFGVTVMWAEVTAF